MFMASGICVALYYTLDVNLAVITCWRVRLLRYRIARLLLFYAKFASLNCPVEKFY